jgi:DNA-binding CsgD family transcriptional regulator
VVRAIENRRLERGQGAEIPTALRRRDLSFRLRRAFPGYLLVQREGHLFVMRPLDVEAPADAAVGMYSEARQREEKLARLVESGRFHTLKELAEELGVSRERARQLLKRIGARLPSPHLVDLQCPECGQWFQRRRSEAKTVRPPRCPACRAKGRELITVRCVRCRNTRELYPSQLDRQATPFCGACWKALSPAERRSWRAPREQSKRRAGVTAADSTTQA